MLRSDVTIPELVRCRYRLIEDDSRSRSVGQIGNSFNPRGQTAGHHLLDALLHVHSVRAEIVHDINHQHFLSHEQAEQKMLGPYVLMISALGFFPRLYQSTTHPAREVVLAQSPLPLPVEDLTFSRRVVIARRTRL